MCESAAVYTSNNNVHSCWIIYSTRFSSLLIVLITIISLSSFELYIPTFKVVIIIQFTSIFFFKASVYFSQLSSNLYLKNRSRFININYYNNSSTSSIINTQELFL